MAEQQGLVLERSGVALGVVVGLQLGVGFEVHGQAARKLEARSGVTEAATGTGTRSGS